MDKLEDELGQYYIIFYYFLISERNYLHSLNKVTLYYREITRIHNGTF